MLTSKRSEIVEYIRSNPDVKSVDIARALSRVNGAVTAHLTPLFRAGVLTRTAIEDKITGQMCYLYRVAEGKSFPVRDHPTHRRRSNRTPSPKVGVLLTVQYGKSESITLSFDQAKQLYDQLKQMFA